MNFFVVGDYPGFLLSRSMKTEGSDKKELTIMQEGEFQHLLSESMFSSLQETIQLADTQGNTGSEKNSSLLLGNMEEVLYLEMAVLNSLEQDELPEEYFSVLEELVAVTAFLSKASPQEVETAEFHQRFQALSERVLDVIKRYLESNVDKEENHPVKQQAELKELITLIDKKLEKVLTVPVKQLPKIDTGFYNTNRFSSFLDETVPSNPITINQLQQPKQSTIQWIIDTTSSQAAREQLIHKLEAILSTTQSRLVNGNQTMTIRLNPDHLGTLHIKLQDTQQGLVAKLVVHSKAAASLLENSVASLKQNLVNANVTVDKVEVVFQDQEQRFLQHHKESNGQHQEFKKKQDDNYDREETSSSFEELLIEELEMNKSVGEWK